MRALQAGLLILTIAASPVGCVGDDSSGSITEGTSGGATSAGSTGEGEGEVSTGEGSTGEGSTGEGSTGGGSVSGSSSSGTQASVSATAPSSDPTDPDTGCHNSGPTIDPGELPAGAVGEPYEVFFAVGGEVGPQDWEVEDEPPAGLVFDPQASSLTGVPEVAGESPFSLAIYYDDSGDGCSSHPAYASYTLVIEG